MGEFARIMRRSGRHASFQFCRGERREIIDHRTINGSQTNQLLVPDMGLTASNSNGAILWPRPSFSWLYRSNRPAKTFIAAKYDHIFFIDRDRGRNAAWLAFKRDGTGIWL